MKLSRLKISTWRAVSVLAVVFALGCGSTEEIRSYTVAKEAAPTTAASAQEAEPGEPTHRMLAAILPAGSQAWFFKVVGPLKAIDERADEIMEFFKSVRLNPGATKPEWSVPEGWTERGPSPMRLATLLIPAVGKPIELSVSGASGSILMNVNRWRGQMKLPEAGEPQLVEFTREIKAGDATMTIVDLKGRFEPGPAMMAPFARGAQSESGQSPELPPGHPPVNGAPDGDR